MQKIKNYVDKIKDELCGAKDYAENFLYYKAQGNNKWAKYYMDMANDELKHANYIHEIAMEEITNLEKVYKPTEDMKNVWESSHKKFVEKSAWIKQMLAM